MRRIVCFFAVFTLTACGAGTDTGDSTDSGTTPTPDVTDSSDTGPGCATDSDCDDANVCTVDICDVETGACASDPAEDGTDCVIDDMDSVCVAGSCLASVCGDGVCEGAEDVGKCPDDCLVEGCKDGEIAGCGEGSCVDESLLGDDSCDADLDCEATGWDAGDCATVDPCGDGTCDSESGEDADTCPDDCATSCGDDEILGCDGETCVDASLLGDLSCDTDLNCEETAWDNGDCEVPDPCGDGACDADSGETIDTCPDDCMEACPEGEVYDCEWVSCLSESTLELTLGDGFCDLLLDCETFDYDGGDCDLPVCGDDFCHADEDSETCPEDCDATTSCGDGTCDPDEMPTDITAAATTCGVSCLGTDDPATCTADCVADETGLTDTCASCFGGTVMCVIANCLLDCSPPNENSIECLSCMESAGCQAEFATCSDANCMGADDVSIVDGTCPADCVVCSDTEVVTCDGGCTEMSWLGDGICDTEFNCIDLDYDNGDCITVCGDGACDPGEGGAEQAKQVVQCVTDCGGEYGCSVDCMADALSISTECSSCHGSMMTCLYDSCLDTCTTEGGDSDACADCLETNSCIDETFGLCMETNCDQSDLEQLMGTCPGDCDDDASACGNGICEPGEGSLDIGPTALNCTASCVGDETCSVECLANALDVSDECASCVGFTMACTYEPCMDICAAEGANSEACELCQEANGCLIDVGACLESTCSAGDIATLGGTCNQDCEDGPDTCGDGYCGPSEAAIDPLQLAADCYEFECGNDQGCIVGCMANDVGLSTDCAACTASTFTCILDNCYDQCIATDTQTDASCEVCALSSACGGEDYADCLETDCSPDDTSALATTCAQDCGEADCLPGQVLDCDGWCHDSDAIGDGICDAVLDCATWGYDGGDCSGPVCGNQICEAGEETTCASDCTVCADGELATCSGECADVANFSNGVCDAEFDCSHLLYDGGDCGGVCGDGICATGEGPLNASDIAASCAAGCANDLDCTAACVAETGLTTDCSSCYASSVICISVTCYDECYMNGDSPECQDCAQNNCFGQDFYDCMAAGCANAGDEDTINGVCAYDCGDCPVGEVTDCWAGCMPAVWLGDGTCHESLNCPAMGNDMGDCEGACGDGVCTEGEAGLQVMDYAYVCSTGCDDDTSCVTDCVVASTQLSEGCAQCHSELIACMTPCQDVCMSEDPTACDSCMEGEGCLVAVEACIPAECDNSWDNDIINGSCPDDCDECDETTIPDCAGGCSPSEWYGDGGCDEVLNCQDTGWDGGDCSCDDDQVLGCYNTCVDSSFIGNGQCNIGLDCEEFGHDGGDCDVCDDDYCGPTENESNCPADCGDSLCPVDQFDDCLGGCTDSSLLGDGVCDEAFGCTTWDWDSGDCCPPGESKDCYGGCANMDWLGDGTCHGNFACTEWSFDNGDCVGCGDGECGLGEDNDSCPEDCAAPECGDDEVLGCDWDCYPLEWVGDGSCDDALACADTNWDNGDCCPDGFVMGCDGACGWADYLGDGSCDDVFNCLEMDQDNGDCGMCGDGICNANTENPSLCTADCGSTGCGFGYVDDCWGGCSSESWLGNSGCDDAFACAAWDWDDGDCCPDDEKASCDGSCVSTETYGDGSCDQAFNCSELSWDGGDCEVCADDEVSTCNGSCAPNWMWGTGDCDEELNCMDLNWDGGDCIDSYCGDGVCDDDENLADCEEDCEEDCDDDALLPTCFDSAVCTDATSLGNGTCDDEFNCGYYSYDDGDCDYCGDGFCNVGFENPTLCPIDCGDSLCGAGESEACDGTTCVDLSWAGDGECDSDLSCAAWDWDGGDCCEDPSMSQVCDDTCVMTSWIADGSCDESLNCEAGEWDGGDCDECGDGTCGLAENNSTCPDDCEAVCADDEVEACDGSCLDGTMEDLLSNGSCNEEFSCGTWDWDGGDCCSPNEVATCDGTCMPASYLGDGTCDDALNCADLDNDAGDCCEDGLTQACDGSCVSADWLGDGECDEEFSCTDANWDDGDCCPDGFIKDCNNDCKDEFIYGDAICDIGFACEDMGWDGGDCCPEGTETNCDGGCSDVEWLGDGECDTEFACAEAGWDGGDCCPTGELPSCNQPDANVLYCTSEDSLGDGFCDLDFDCDMYNFDEGDCIVCGDGTCEADEESTCPADCAPAPGETCYPDEGGVGTIDCDGECYLGSSTEECDEAFNCPEADFDWGECLDTLPKLVINEIDVRSVEGSQTEFIELMNNSDEIISLDGYGLEVFTMLSGYSWVDVADAYAVVGGDAVGVTELPPGEFLVVGLTDTLVGLAEGSAMVALLPAPELNDDGAAVLTLYGGPVDSIAWSDDESMAIFGEGEPVAADTIANSLSRCPDGTDTDDNFDDFWATLPTPGGINYCE